MSIYKRIEGIAYCHVHDREWLDGEHGCQATWYEKVESEDWDCVESPLYWLDRTEIPAPTIHLFKDRDRRGRVRSACGRYLKPLRLSTTIHGNVTCQTCIGTKQFRGVS